MLLFSLSTLELSLSHHHEMVSYFSWKTESTVPPSTESLFLWLLQFLFLFVFGFSSITLIFQDMVFFLSFLTFVALLNWSVLITLKNFYSLYLQILNVLHCNSTFLLWNVINSFVETERVHSPPTLSLPLYSNVGKRHNLVSLSPNEVTYK